MDYRRIILVNKTENSSVYKMKNVFIIEKNFIVGTYFVNPLLHITSRWHDFSLFTGS